MGAGLPSRSGDRRSIGAWESLLLALVGTIAVFYLVIGSGVDDIVDNDGAYYYGVARHMALTGRFEEPIVWHFLAPPRDIVHVPFDYWGSMTSLVLLPPLLIFGATPAVAFRTMSAISAASVVAFWYLIAVAMPLRYRASQLLALVIFAFSPAMTVYRFQPESIVVAQAFLLLSLIAFSGRRLVAALVSAFGILLTRGDGAILFGLVFLAVLVEGWRDVEHARRSFWNCLLAGVACVGGYVVWSFLSFGAPTPPATRVVPFLRRYEQVFDFGVVHELLWNRLPRWLEWHYVAGRFAFAFDWLRLTPFTPRSDWWLVLGFVSIWIVRARRPAAVLTWILCFAGYFLLAMVSGPGFHPGRAPYTFTPLVVVTGALGLDAVLDRLHAWAHDGRRALVGNACVLSVGLFFLSGLPMTYGFPQLGMRSVGPALERLDTVLDGAPVASNLPWYVIAYTRSPAVSIPYNGEAAIGAVLARYEVRWMVVFDNPPRWVDGESRSVLMKVLSGAKTSLGPFGLERVPVPIPHAVFRVHGPEPSDATRAEAPKPVQAGIGDRDQYMQRRARPSAAISARTELSPSPGHRR